MSGLITLQERVEFGDFQTPAELARRACRVVKESGFDPVSILEPTCARGSFLNAAMEAFPDASKILGYDLNPAYVDVARKAIQSRFKDRVEVFVADFFGMDWESVVDPLHQPILIVGNPPWVTNATLGSIGSDNLPAKSNIDGLSGFEALTGKSNFDISEWMLRKYLEWVADKCATIAVLCKSSVARKVLVHAWSSGHALKSSSMYRIDAKTHFDVSVDAVLLVMNVEQGSKSADCAVYESLGAASPQSRFGLFSGRLVSDMRTQEELDHLHGTGLSGWRSGVKHDCSKVFELSREGDQFLNGLDEIVELEAEVIFPLFKSSDVARGRPPRKWLLVPQRSMGDSPVNLKSRAPLAYKYLEYHAAMLNRRKSSIYKNRPPYSIFGIGSYSFAPWKVAISGLYKELTFRLIGPVAGQPPMFDDTCYIFPCDSEEEGKVLFDLLISAPARRFFESMIFWDAKRPITSKILNSLDLASLARSLGKWSDATRICAERQHVVYSQVAHQQLLFHETAYAYNSGLTKVGEVQRQ